MSDTECPRCGSPMRRGDVCPVCEIPYHANDGRAPDEPEKAAETFAGRLWQSGRLGLLIAICSFVLGTTIPILFVQRSDHLGPRVGKSPIALFTASGTYGSDLKSTTLLAVPVAAFFLLTFLGSRRTRSVAMASRPLVLVVSIIPSLAALMPMLKLAKHHRFEYTPGPAFVVIVLGSIFGVIAATRFGRGMPEPKRRSALRQTDDDDD